MQSPIKRKKVHSLRWWERFIVQLAVGAMKLWLKTLRVAIDEPHQRLMESLTKDPKLCALWHNRLFVGPYIKKRWGAKRKVYGLVSASKDGAWLAEILKNVKMGAIRGSSSFRGQFAYKEMLTALSEGVDVVITPDGPRGPCYSIKAGLVNLILETRLPLYLLGVKFDKAWRLKSWDKFYVPKPFSKITICVEVLTFSDLEKISTDAEVITAYLRGRLMAINPD